MTLFVFCWKTSSGRLAVFLGPWAHLRNIHLPPSLHIPPLNPLYPALAAPSHAGCISYHLPAKRFIFPRWGKAGTRGFQEQFSNFLWFLTYFSDSTNTLFSDFCFKTPPHPLTPHLLISPSSETPTCHPLLCGGISLSKLTYHPKTAASHSRATVTASLWHSWISMKSLRATSPSITAAPGAKWLDKSAELMCAAFRTEI